MAGNAAAFVEVTDGCDADPTQITSSLPLPGTAVYSGGTLKFRDSVQIATCGNGLFFNKVNFYITEDKIFLRLTVWAGAPMSAPLIADAPLAVALRALMLTARLTLVAPLNGVMT